MAERRKIGTATLTETVDRRKSYETAAWSKTIRCEPQTVDVYAELDDKGRVVDTSIGWAYEGMVVDAHFPSQFGGVSYTSGDRPEQLGQPETFHVTPYAHAVALGLLKEAAIEQPEAQADQVTRLELDVEPLYDPFSGQQGRGHYTAGLFLDPSPERYERSRGVQAALQGQPILHDSPEATFGWSMAKKVEGQRLAEESKRTLDIADYALRTYAPDLQPKPELDGLEH